MVPSGHQPEGAGGGFLLTIPATHTMTDKAIIWDYDGTIADTQAVNFTITKKIMHRLMGMRSEEYSALASLENYISATKRAMNWRELYRDEFKMSEKSIDEAGALWTEYQLDESSETIFYDGIEDAIKSLARFPSLIFSQNSRTKIAQALERKDLRRCFLDIIGYEELSSANQKPAPDGLLLCLDRLGPSDSRHVFFIGDHETDTLCGHRANMELRGRNADARIINVAALYGSKGSISGWQIKPDHIAESTQEIFRIVESY